MTCAWRLVRTGEAVGPHGLVHAATSILVQVPKEYAGYPQLLGRATVEMSYVLNESRDSPIPVTHTLTMVLDGFNAPVSAGCFADLVRQQWYDNMEVQRADGFVVQTGKPVKGEGYVDPATGATRRCAPVIVQQTAVCASHSAPSTVLVERSSSIRACGRIIQPCMEHSSASWLRGSWLKAPDTQLLCCQLILAVHGLVWLRYDVHPSQANFGHVQDSVGDQSGG